MSNKKSNNNFLIQGSILAIAGIMVRVIGLIYRVPLTNILGTAGMNYYNAAFKIYSILLLLSSQAMPIAVSKLVSARLVKNEERNAYSIFKGSLIYGLIVGGSLGLLAFFGADVLAGIYNYPSSARALRVLAPTITIVSVLGVFRGYFQGMGDMAPTAISQVIEQIVNAIVSVAAAYYLYSFGLNITAATESESLNNAYSYSAAGGTLGTCLGAVVALLILVVLFYKLRPTIMNNIAEDTNTEVVSYRKIYKMLIFTITPVLLSTVIYQIGGLIDDSIYSNIMEHVFGVTDELERGKRYGIYISYYQLLTTMPIAIASAMSVSIVPTIVRSFTENNISVVKNKIAMAIRFSMIIAIPCGIGLSVLGGPIVELLFDVSDIKGEVTSLMMLSVCPVMAFSLSTITNAILQGIDKLKVPMIHSGISLAIHLVFLPVLLIVFKLDLYAVAIGDFVFSLVICILNARAIDKALDYKQEYKLTFIKPMISGLVMGAVSFVIYTVGSVLFERLGLGMELSNGISVCVAILIAIVTYFATLIKIKGIDEEILMSFPKGNLIVRMCKKFRLI